MNETVHLLPFLRPIQHNEKFGEHNLILFTAVYMLYGNIAELYGKRAAWHDNQSTSNRMLWRPAVILKQGLTISKIRDVCLIEDVWAMLKELKRVREKIQSSVDKVNSLGVKGNGQGNVEKSY